MCVYLSLLSLSLSLSLSPIPQPPPKNKPKKHKTHLQELLDEVLGLPIGIGDALPHGRRLRDGRLRRAVHGGGGGEDCVCCMLYVCWCGWWEVRGDLD